MLEDYVAGTLEAVADPGSRRAPGVEARMALVAALLEGGAVELSRNEDGGRFGIAVVDGDKAAQIIVKMLAEVRRVRFAGDRKGAAQLLDASGVWLSSNDRASLRSRWKSLGLPDAVAFGYPRTDHRPGGGAMDLVPGHGSFTPPKIFSTRDSKMTRFAPTRNLTF